MLIMGNRGLLKLKLRIHRMKNHILLSEWQSIRLMNSDCIPNEVVNCHSCDLAKCLCYLTYEEIITTELLNRGLFDFAINNCLRYKVPHIYEY
ncbi:MAG: hypothetical protein KAS22_00940 [Candidatus Heimdallarchaeota archaeon]|nr:hypothetical protein [Candidatus Heimdallarchaeota archaeon]MCK5185121.1 hypothetical protein [Candidatus Heimdallarchaeota archaeon]